MGVNENSEAATQRFAFCKALLGRLAQHNDIILIQEAKYNSQQHNKVQRMLPKYSFYHNSHTTNSAGTFIAVRTSYARCFDIRHEVSHSGYIHTLCFNPKQQGFAFSVTNTYLLQKGCQGVSRWARVRNQLEAPFFFY